MALPSSPPLMPFDPPSSPPSLPTFPTLSRPVSAAGRKRQLSEYGSLSSDPIFSDSTSDAEQPGEGSRPKRKKLIKGPWWSAGRRKEQHLRRSMVKNEMARNVDSGVWMGSDELEDSADKIVSSQQRLEGLMVEDQPESSARASIRLTTAEDKVEAIIGDCLESGRETVDLSGLGLQGIANATLRPLHQLIRSTHANLTQPPSEDEFAPLTPSIQLYLAHNALVSLPHELFSLANITVLSLRNNQLNNIPSTLNRLRRLKELNISGNNIRYLPWELLDMLCAHGDATHTSLRPNPLLEPTDLQGPPLLSRAQFSRAVIREELSRFADTRDTYENIRQRLHDDGSLDLRGELELRLKLGRMLRIQYLQEASRAGQELKLGRDELIYLASSAVQYYNVDGTSAHGAKESSYDTHHFVATLHPTLHRPDCSGSAAAAPSLFELSLRRLQSGFDLDDATAQARDDLPPAVTAALLKAARNVALYANNETCTTCGKEFVIARARWIEYWFNGFSSDECLRPDTVLPFLRKSCSWACATPSEAGAFRC